MSKLLFSIMKFPKKSNSKSLGRWNTIVDLNKNRDISKDIELNCDWANHDHCGGELCSKQVIITNKNNNKKTLDDMKFDEIYPFIL